MYNINEDVILIGFAKFDFLSDRVISGAFINNHGTLMQFDMKIHNIFSAANMQEIVGSIEPQRPNDHIIVHNIVDLPNEEEDVIKIQRFILQEFVNKESKDIKQYPLVLLPHVARFIKKNNIKFSNNAEVLKSLYRSLKTSALGTGLLNEDFLFMMDTTENNKVYSSYPRP